MNRDLHDLPPPPITITDPRGGVLTTDLLGSGGDDDREPWQPTLRQVALLLVVVLVVAIGSVPVLLVQRDDRSAKADRAELASLSLTQYEDDSVDANGSGIPLVLENDGPTTLRVLGAHVDRTGYRDQHVTATLSRGSRGTVLLEPLGACPPPGAVPSGPSGVIVTVRTPRGQRTTVRVGVRDSFFAESYAAAIGLRCKAFPVEESFLADVLDLRSTGDAVSATVRLTNRSRDPHTLDALNVSSGFALTVDHPAPLTLAAGQEVVVGVTVRVTACKLARTQMTAGTDPERSPTDYSFEGPSFGDIDAVAAGDAGYETPFPLVFSDALTQLVTRLVVTTCRL